MARRQRDPLEAIIAFFVSSKIDVARTALTAVTSIVKTREANPVELPLNLQPPASVTKLKVRRARKAKNVALPLAQEQVSTAGAAAGIAAAILDTPLAPGPRRRPSADHRPHVDRPNASDPVPQPRIIPPAVPAS